MYKACVFDLDGTLTDTLESLTYSVNETMKEIGLPGISSEQCREFVGNGAKVLIEKTLRASGDGRLDRFDEAFSAYQRIFNVNCTYRVAPYSGVRKMLEEMKRQGLKLGVLSNKPDRQAVYVVEQVFGKNLFDHIQGQKDGVPRKPDPSALLGIAEKFGADAGEILYVGDSEVDGATGKAAGMDTVLVSWGFRSRDILEEADPLCIADSTDEILNTIRKRNQGYE